MIWDLKLEQTGPAASDQRLQRRPGPSRVQRVQRGQVGGAEPLVVDEVAEQPTGCDENARLPPRAPGPRDQAVPQPVHHLDGLALLIDPLRVTRPARHYRGRAAALAPRGELVPG